MTDRRILMQDDIDMVKKKNEALREKLNLF